MRLTVSSVIPARQLTAVSGALVHVPDRDSLVHLQFRRFAGCPVCNLHLRSFASRNGEVIAAGVREVVVFHAPAGELRPQVADLPFAVVADPGKQLYAEFGVESAKRALLDPRAWPAITKGVLTSLWGIVRHRRPAPALNPHGGRFGLPADFLIGTDGRVLAVKYGQHANDHWPVGELLGLARRERQAAIIQAWFGEAITGRSRQELGLAPSAGDSFILTREDTSAGCPRWPGSPSVHNENEKNVSMSAEVTRPPGRTTRYEGG